MTHLRLQEPSVPGKSLNILCSTFITLSVASYRYVKSDYKMCKTSQDLTEQSSYLVKSCQIVHIF